MVTDPLPKFSTIGNDLWKYTSSLDAIKNSVYRRDGLVRNSEISSNLKYGSFYLFNQ